MHGEKEKSFCGSNNNKHKGKGGSQASQLFIHHFKLNFLNSGRKKNTLNMLVHNIMA